uniref:Uncharacterized protein n=1 Tax=uncultured bacterium AOCefta2 TaxID=654977 RepID=D6MLW9_9BACT|nr:hypothetical protein WISOIL_0020 [uncultured bacterium AOCefta2]
MITAITRSRRSRDLGMNGLRCLLGCRFSNRFRQTLILAFALALVGAKPAMALWSTNPSQNNEICTTVTGKQSQQVIADGSGGAYICWTDSRNGTNICAQHMNADGALTWAADGVIVCNLPYTQSTPAMVSDGAGGAIIVWRDFRASPDPFNPSPQIIAQRLGPNGNAMWTTAGVVLCSAARNRMRLLAVSDGLGGVIAAWRDFRNGVNYTIYAQRVDSSGQAQWTTDGLGIVVLGSDHDNQTIAADGSGGAFCAWEDYRSGPSDIYAQHVTSNGGFSWTANGIAICSELGYQTTPSIAPDGSSGAYLCWQDAQIGGYAIVQRVASNGATMWSANGTSVSLTSRVPQMVSTPAGVLIATGTPNGYFEIRVQLVSPLGVVQWPSPGAVVSQPSMIAGLFAITDDGSAGMIVSWTQDLGGGNTGILAQRVTSSGIASWTQYGVIVCNAANSRSSPLLANLLNSGYVDVWLDKRTNSGNDIYGSRLNTSGQLAGPVSAVSEWLQFD